MPIIQFKGKTAVESYHRVVPHHTLEIDAKLSLGKKPSLDGNLIIEGDNLIALKSLLPTHAGRIKCIYIDPPYNTGNEGWIYNDNLTQPQFKEWIGHAVGKEGEDACRHDKWCCMMYPRLQLLKELLHDDGAIFVSIADHELHHLRILMDEIFGEESFVATFVWKSRVKPSNIGEKKRKPQQVSEYILCYSKGTKGDEKTFGLIESGEERSYPHKLGKRHYRLTTILKSNRGENRRDTMRFTIAGFTPPEDQRWQGGADHIKKLYETGYIEFRDGTPFRRYFEDEEAPEHTPLYTFISPELSGTSEQGKIELNQIFGLQHGFDTVKPLALLRWLFRFGTSEDEIVLDSFAGSGTTAHAVLELNKEDGGNRKFILVQQPFDTKENEKEKFNICEKITRERVARVSKGYSYKTSSGKTEKVEGLGGEFSYVRIGEKLMGEYRNFGDQLPAYEEIARYIYFTETSQNFDAKKMDEATGKIGEWKNTSYYLLYSPNRKEDRALDVEFLTKLKDKNPRKVIYCEKVWVHREDLHKFGDVRPMLVPFNLK